MFQSTPPVSRRRCQGRHGQLFPSRCFNPRLLFPEGDACILGAFRHEIKKVSIHASCFQKAMRKQIIRGDWKPTFQSTPPVSRRRCQSRSVQTSVRILFQSTPPVSRRRCIRAAVLSSRDEWFQSTPPVSRRRCPSHRANHRQIWRFNPRLLFPEGDASRQSKPPLRPTCFNPRLLFPEGDARKAPDLVRYTTRFNPRLLFPEGDARCRHRRRRGLPRFNPRLLFPEGDADAPGASDC